MGYTAQDLFKTKICEYYQRGHCPRDKCTFAHGEQELRKLTPQGGRLLVVVSRIADCIIDFLNHPLWRVPVPKSRIYADMRYDVEYLSIIMLEALSSGIKQSQCAYWKTFSPHYRTILLLIWNMLLGNILVILDTEFSYVGFDTQGGDMTTVSEEDPFQIAWTGDCPASFLRGLGHDHRLGFDEVSTFCLTLGRRI